MRIFFIFLTFFITVDAKYIESHYKVTYGMFGSIAKAKMVLESDEKKYRMIVEAEAIRLAKTLSGGRKEYYESSGHVKDGIFYTDRYTVVKEREGKKITKRYEVNDGNITLKKFTEENGDVEVSEEGLDYLAYFDLLSMYANTKERINSEDTNHWSIKTIGAKSEDKKVSITRLVGKAMKKTKKELRMNADHYLLVNIHQKIFASKEGKLKVAMDKDGVAQKAVLKDVIFFGDITGTLTRKIIK